MTTPNSETPAPRARKAMGSRAAYQEAVRRFGRNAIVAVAASGCKVGRGFFGAIVVKGSGKTWAAAFRDADRRAGKKGG